CALPISEFTGQQYEPFLLVSPQCQSSAGACGFDGASGNGHARIVLRLPCRRLGRPCRERLAGVGWFTTPLVAHPRSLSLCLLLRGLVLGAGFALSEPANGRESGAGGRFVLNCGKVGRTVLLCLLHEWSGDLGTDLLSGVFGSADCGGVLLVFGAVGVSLGVEACG